MNVALKSMISPELVSLLEAQRPGYCLDQAFYTDDTIFDLDMRDVISKQWLFVEHEERLPDPGDLLVYDIGQDSIVLCRNREGRINAFFNVCRHRGSRVCKPNSTHSKRLVCPYHAWTYDLNGNLIVAKQMPDSFRKEEYSLHPCNLEILEGLVFINLDSEGASSFQELRDNLSSFIAPHGLKNAKIAETRNYTINANWKLVVENFRECYHCTPSHPEYSSINAYVSAGDKKLGGYLPEVQAWIDKHQDLPFEKGFKNFPTALQPHHAWRMPINNGYCTATQDGKPAAPLMGDFEQYDDGETGIFFSPLTYFYLNNDHAVTFRITPIATQATTVTVNWLVNRNAKEGDDYDIDRLTWLWHHTTLQDGEITEGNQQGVNSRWYQPGPYSEREYGSADFTAWYVAKLLCKPEQRQRFR